MNPHRSDLADIAVGASILATDSVANGDEPTAIKLFALVDQISEAVKPTGRTVHRDRALDAIIADVDDGTGRPWDWRVSRPETLAWLRTAPVDDIRRGLVLVGAITTDTTGHRQEP